MRDTTGNPAFRSLQGLCALGLVAGLLQFWPGQFAEAQPRYNRTAGAVEARGRMPNNAPSTANRGERPRQFQGPATPARGNLRGQAPAGPGRPNAGPPQGQRPNVSPQQGANIQARRNVNINNINTPPPYSGRPVPPAGRALPPGAAVPPPPGPRPPVVMPAPIILPGYNPYYSLPPNTSSVVIAGITYFLINGIHYQAQHQGEKVVYVPVQIPATP